MLNTTNLGQTIKPPDRIGFVKTGQQSGQFTDGYATVNYNCTVNGNSMRMSGVVQFSPAIVGNFRTIQSFQISLVLGNSQGRVLTQQGLSAAVENSVSSPVDFNTTVPLPLQAATMAFSYNGTAYGGVGSDSPTSFWADPVER
jgi:hypothetical protein